jgi:hypothetical protein
MRVHTQCVPRSYMRQHLHSSLCIKAKINTNFQIKIDISVKCKSMSSPQITLIFLGLVEIWQHLLD